MFWWVSGERPAGFDRNETKGGHWMEKQITIWKLFCSCTSFRLLSMLQGHLDIYATRFITRFSVSNISSLIYCFLEWHSLEVESIHIPYMAHPLPFISCGCDVWLKLWRVLIDVVVSCDGWFKFGWLVHSYPSHSGAQRKKIHIFQPSPHVDSSNTEGI